MDWFMHHAVLVALVGAGVAVAYGLWLTTWLLKQPAGNERMQEIARAVQEGRGRLPEAAVHDDRGRRDRAVPPARVLRQARLGGGVRLPDRRRALRGRRLHRHERRGSLERAHRRGRARRGRTGAQGGVPGGVGHRPPRGGARARRRRRLLLVPHRRSQPHADLGDPRPRRARVRRLADLGLRPSRRRHLHEGRRRRRRPRRQDRGGDPGGRPAQRRGDRRQRRRQRRRLRRHGRRPVRDLRRHRRRRDAARDRGRARREQAVPLPARARRRLRDRLGDRHLLRPSRQGRERDHRRALQGRARGDRPLGARLHPGHEGVRRRPLQLQGPLHLGHRRPGRHLPARGDHRVLHGHPLGSGEEDRQGLADRPRDEHHRGPRGRDAGHRAARGRDRGRDPDREPLRRALRHRRRRDGAALDDRPDRRARRVRPGHRQRGRHRRDGRPARVGARGHRSARRGRQHDQGRDQGLRDRLGRARGARPVRLVHERPARQRSERRCSRSTTRG